MNKLIAYAIKIFKIEAEAIMALSHQIDETFSKVIKSILSCKGRVIVCGMGKSGIIGRKISSTLASTGTPSFFMHPAEAFHGDLGILKKTDVLLLISYSGETEEILRLIPFLKENGNMLISMTGKPKSTLANSSNYHLDISVITEACPLQMAPTSSTTASLVMGDALAIVLMKERCFKAEDFARFHPGGKLGRRLLAKVEDAMVTKNLPIITKNSFMKEVIEVITCGRQGVAIVLDKTQHVIGIITDSDLRKALNEYENIFMLKAEDIMSRNPKVINKEMRLYKAEKLFNIHGVITLIVSNEERKLLGILQSYDI